MPDLNIKEIILKSSEYLKNKGLHNARLDVELILSHFLSISRMDLYLQFEKIISEDKADQIRKAIIERSKRKPLQYILGEVHFLDCVIEVNETVLIPRPETEFMVDLILKSFFDGTDSSKEIGDFCYGRTSPLNVSVLQTAGGNSASGQHKCVPTETPLQSGAGNFLDLCTGSVAIAIALKKKIKDANVFAIDICEKALETAQKNAKKNDCDIHFIKSDLFCVPSQGGRNGQHKCVPTEGGGFDLIISNPPYISEEEYQNLEPELFFEPKIALVAKDESFYFYKKIIEEARPFLKDGANLFLEINSNLAEEIVSIATENKYTHIEILKDLNERNRFLRLIK